MAPGPRRLQRFLPLHVSHSPLQVSCLCAWCLLHSLVRFFFFFFFFFFFLSYFSSCCAPHFCASACLLYSASRPGSTGGPQKCLLYSASDLPYFTPLVCAQTPSSAATQGPNARRRLAEKAAHGAPKQARIHPSRGDVSVACLAS